VGAGVGSGGAGCGTSVGIELASVGDNHEAVQVDADGTHVFWVDDYGLHRSLPDGSELTALDSGSPFYSVNDMTVAPGGIYLTGYSGIRKLDTDGNSLGAVTTLMSVGTVAEDGATVFFTRANEGAIYTAPSDPMGSGAGSVLAGTESVGPHAGGVVARDGYVYWSSGSILYRAPQGGGSYEVLSDDASPKIWNESVAITDTYIVWIGQQLHAMPLAGTPADAFVVADTEVSSWRIAADETSVYYPAGNGVYRVDITGGEPEMLDCWGDTSGGAIAVDDTNVYWVGGTIAEGPGDFATYSLRATPKR
jgi:hypothetical protein